MYTFLTYTYLLLPLFALIFKKNWKYPYILTLGIYGVVGFIFLNIFDAQDLPEGFKKIHAFAYTIFEYASFTLLIRLNIDSKRIKRFMDIMSALFLIFQVIFYMNFSVQKLDSIPVGIETILVFIFIFLFFYESLKNPKTLYIYSHHCFWVAVGILLYLGGAFFIYILANHIDFKELQKYWPLTYIAEILKNLLFIVSIFLYSPKPKKTEFAANPHLPYLDMNN